MLHRIHMRDSEHKSLGSTRLMQYADAIGALATLVSQLGTEGYKVLRSYQGSVAMVLEGDEGNEIYVEIVKQRKARDERS